MHRRFLPATLQLAVPPFLAGPFQFDESFVEMTCRFINRPLTVRRLRGGMVWERTPGFRHEGYLHRPGRVPDYAFPTGSEPSRGANVHFRISVPAVLCRVAQTIARTAGLAGARSMALEVMRQQLKMKRYGMTSKEFRAEWRFAFLLAGPAPAGPWPIPPPYEYPSASSPPRSGPAFWPRIFRCASSPEKPPIFRRLCRFCPRSAKAPRTTAPHGLEANGTPPLFPPCRTLCPQPRIRGQSEN